MPDLFGIMIAVRGAGHEAGRIMRKACGQRLRDRVGELVIRDLVPYIEKETPARPQDPACLLVGQNLVRKKHRAELAGDRVEALIGEWQGKGVGLPPRDLPALRL